MTTDISASELLRQAGALEEAGKLLLEAATKIREGANLLAGLATNGEAIAGPAVGQSPPRLRRDGEPTRFGQIDAFLREHGRSSRETIIKRSGVPPGSVRALLNIRNFDQDEEGNWSAKDW